MPVCKAWYVHCDWPKCMRTKLLVQNITYEQASDELRHRNWTIGSDGAYCPLHSGKVVPRDG